MSQVKASFRSEQRNRGVTFLLLRRRLSSGLRSHHLPCSGVSLVSRCSCGPPSSLAVGVFVSTSLSSVASSSSVVFCSPVASGSSVVSCSLMASCSPAGRGMPFLSFCFYCFMFVVLFYCCGFGSKKIKYGGSCEYGDAWPKLGEATPGQWVNGQSFAERLQGINKNKKTDGHPENVKDLSDDSMLSDSDKEDYTPLSNISEHPTHNFPTFSFSEKMQKMLYKAWSRAVIVKLLGRNIGYKLLPSILQSLRAKRGVISLINIGNDFFVVKLSNREDYLNVLTGGPWMLFDQYLMVRP
ncbi:hypothetical protein K1719_008727 [Acacia pycnantha]|nr:hypothetical protein K1719_008727 [Acacia pycnantha]